ncbi:electron transfer flavoprotein subunit alpha/FixB family protein [Haloarchaeobius sp. TZWWS8]|uniref:electron transfer flavoprotein subunit alpha/FixB family protein n=1 Tax=Haloarchaeobius sp. TZWWS8 TaxID=3446121 RepID=UPI003EB803C9
MTEFDPGEYDISELGPALKDIEDVDELTAILEAEEEGQDRAAAKKLIESRIEKFTADDEALDADSLDPGDMSVADIGNAVRDIDDVSQLEALLERETEGQDRKSAKRLIEKRIDDLSESDEEAEEGEVEPDLPPEEKYPELDHPTADKQHVRALADGTYGDMWVYCETQRGDLLDVSREMLGKARELMDDYNDDYGEDERVVAVLIGDDVEKHADECIACGADVVVYTEEERLDRFRHKPYTEIFCDMARWGGEPGEGDPEPSDWRDYDEPRYVLFPATNNGRDLSALVQGELDSGLASDCSGLYIDSAEISNPVKTGKPGTTKTFERILHMKRPDFSGFEYSTILCIDNPNREFHPQGGSVIPGSFDLPEQDPSREGEVVRRDTELDDGWFRVEVQDADVLDSGVDLSGRDVIVAMGRGIGDDPTRGMELGVELADSFEDADVGVTRGIVTGSYQFDGHVEQYTKEERQIGETGQVVEPKLYIAAGISGAVQHKVGMDESDVIIAINTDPDARIRDFSDYFIEGDLFDVMPRLIEAVKTGELEAAIADAAVAGGDDDD